MKFKEFKIWKYNEDFNQMALMFSPKVPIIKNLGIVFHHSGDLKPVPDERCDWYKVIYRWHTEGRGWDSIGYDFVIERTGDIVATDRWLYQREGYHAVGLIDGESVNKRCVGVCIVGNGNLQKMTPEQKHAIALLYDYLSVFGIKNFYPHAIFSKKKTCPTANYWKDILEAIGW